MLNVGLPQSDVVGYLLMFRDDVRGHIAIVPTVAEEGEFPRFLVVRPRAFDEISRQHRALPQRPNQISFFPPEFVSDKEGWAALAREIGLPTTELVLIEIGDLVTKIHAALAETQTATRGRR